MFWGDGIGVSRLFSVSFTSSRASGVGGDGFQFTFFVKSIILRDLFFRSPNIFILSQLRAKSVKSPAALGRNLEVPQRRLLMSTSAQPGVAATHLPTPPAPENLTTYWCDR